MNVSSGLSPTRLDALRRKSPQMVDQLAHLVSAETPSNDLEACRHGAHVVASLVAELLDTRPEVVDVAGRRHLRLRWPGARRIMLIGHFDTVWPLGTLADWPFQIDAAAGTATGPGCFDMKAGIVQMLHAVASLDAPDGLEILLTSDEEIGSPTSRSLVEEAATGAEAALVLEPSAAGRLKIGRKGIGAYRVTITGRAAHAGLEPERGANALISLGHVLTSLEGLARPELGTTVTPTLASGGTATNVVPAQAQVDVDVRVCDPGEAARVDLALRGLTTRVPGTTVAVGGGLRRPPMPAGQGADLHRRASTVAQALGLGPLPGIAVGGGSDGNFTAAVGCPTLDGLGAVGDGAHAAGEWIQIGAMPERAAVLAHLIDDLRATAMAR